jgi:putative phosphoesterase
MLLGILSDTHDRVARTAAALTMLRDAGAEAIVHCGDFTSPQIVELLAELLAGSPSYVVFGNNDSGRLRELEQAAANVGAMSLGPGDIVTLAGRTIAITHGHLAAETRRLLALEPDYLLTGHSHRRHDLREGRTRRINPGALHRTRTFTVALLNLASDEIRFLLVPP